MEATEAQRLFDRAVESQRASRHAEAVGLYRQILAAWPGHADSWRNLGVALKIGGELDGAIEAFGRAIDTGAARGDVFAYLGHALRDAGRLDEAIAAYRRGVEISGDVRIADSLLVALHAHPAYGREELFAEHAEWARRFINHNTSIDERHPSGPLTPTLSRRERGKSRGLKLGYVAADLGDHPLGRFLLPLLENHDRETFEVFVYNDHARPDAVSARLRKAVDHWRECAAFSHEQLAGEIRRDGIDVLVDLTIHGPGSRLLAFSLKPAPVQVTYLAYAGTTGVRAIDYRLTDASLDPPGVDESLYFERSIRLPHSWWCYPEPEEAPAVSPAPVGKNGHLTFGCLNSFGKTNPQMMSLWAEVMSKAPGSRLILHAHEGSHRERARKLFASHGVDGSRVGFVGFLPVAQYLATYGRIDVCLDTYPWAGGATTFDALWMGAPVVTLAGETAVSRGGLSILSNIGLEELVARRPEEFVRIASSLSLDSLREWRGTLRGRMRASPLMDGRRFARDIEAAYRAMWERQLAREEM